MYEECCLYCLGKGKNEYQEYEGPLSWPFLGGRVERPCMNLCEGTGDKLGGRLGGGRKSQLF